MMHDVASDLSHLIIGAKKNKYWRAYQLKRTQRFVWHTLMAFVVQYITITHVAQTYPALPMYPPIGTVFVLLYLLGSPALIGLCLGSLCAYANQGLLVSLSVLYLSADIVGGYAAVYVSRRVFSSDRAVLTSIQAWITYIKWSMFICLGTSCLRMLALMLMAGEKMSLKIWGYDALNFWLADLSALMVFSGFILSWISVYLGREKIGQRKLGLYRVVVLLVLVVFVVISLKNIMLFFLAGMALALYLAYSYGFFISTLLTYVMSMLLLSYVMLHQQAYLQAVGIGVYTLGSLIFCLFVLAMLFMGRTHARQTNHSHPLP